MAANVKVSVLMSYGDRVISNGCHWIVTPTPSVGQLRTVIQSAGALLSAFLQQLQVQAVVHRQIVGRARIPTFITDTQIISINQAGNHDLDGGPPWEAAKFRFRGAPETGAGQASAMYVTGIPESWTILGALTETLAAQFNELATALVQPQTISPFTFQMARSLTGNVNLLTLHPCLRGVADRRLTALQSRRY